MVAESSATMLNWNQIITLFLSSAVINGGLSALINYIFNIKKSQKEREANIIQDKLNLYSILINCLNRLIEIAPDAFPANTSLIKTEYTQIFIMLDSILADKYHLLEYAAISKIMWIKMVYLQQPPNIRWDAPISQNDNRIIKTELEKLRDLLICTYNNVIIPEYKKITSKNIVEKLIQKIP
jgi:hypothetical protein